jgi:hypothetical protein
MNKYSLATKKIMADDIATYCIIFLILTTVLMVVFKQKFNDITLEIFEFTRVLVVFLFGFRIGTISAGEAYGKKKSSL